jgi:hypothetical protein
MRNRNFTVVEKMFFCRFYRSVVVQSVVVVVQFSVVVVAL